MFLVILFLDSIVWSFLSIRLSSRLHLIDKKINIVKYYYNLNQPCFIWIYLQMYSILAMLCWMFSTIPPVFRVTWSFRNHSNMQIIFLLWMRKTFVLLNIFVETFQDSLMNTKKPCSFEIVIFRNVFTVTFDPFNASLMNKYILS